MSVLILAGIKVSNHFNSSPPGAAYTPVNRINIGADNGFSPIRRQPIIQTSGGILSAGPWEWTSVEF